jgi:hypothetical protein
MTASASDGTQEHHSRIDYERATEHHNESHH